MIPQPQTPEVTGQQPNHLQTSASLFHSQYNLPSVYIFSLRLTAKGFLRITYEQKVTPSQKNIVHVQ